MSHEPMYFYHHNHQVVMRPAHDKKATEILCEVSDRLEHRGELAGHIATALNAYEEKLNVET